ncbi:fumarylacetoacetate hydrolase family protein [Aeromicrobium ginsengisoli]|uniref:Fumarylacetoacetate hydrolase family protein n=1 Tax=Aeromicrobium ginsengisoli TaxID=363867 RepID=A0A5M4FD34_9ACTN|nr:fumarylacetoacetate hydrolase family protein [Aeromicrobium ginsengisoli]KAA1397118.1 fumarylacetoacetate hydrolase family protein [Aeromicrobium ginsengisoli]
MKLARQVVEDVDGKSSRILVMGEHAWIDVRSAVRHEAESRGATPGGARRLAEALVPSSMSAALAGGAAFLDAARAAAEDEPEMARVVHPNLTNALDPATYRDFMVFEEHFSFGYRWQDKPVPDVLYQMPISYAGDPRSFIGPGEEIPWPGYTERLDYELELGIVIGAPGTDLTPDEALDHVLGLTILNDVSARDIQAREMTGALGPSKGKHFACVTGPLIVTLDELSRDGLRMTARVNGETTCETSSAEMVWSVAEIVAWASQGEQLLPGTLLGSGTCNGGSTIETGRVLAPGDVIELEIEGLGVLSNVLGTPASAGWAPTERERTPDGKAARHRFLR